MVTDFIVPRGCARRHKAKQRWRRAVRRVLQLLRAARRKDSLTVFLAQPAHAELLRPRSGQRDWTGGQLMPQTGDLQDLLRRRWMQ